MTGKQAARQRARRQVAETLAIRQREQEARDKHCAELAVLVLAALAERDAAVANAELTAAAAIAQLLGVGLNAMEVSEWCGGLGVREVNRLAKLAGEASGKTAAR